MKFPTSLRLGSVSALMLLLAACGGGDDGADLSSTRNDLSAADIDAALGPADQRAITDVGAENFGSDDPANTIDSNTTANQATANQQERQ